MIFIDSKYAPALVVLASGLLAAPAMFADEVSFDRPGFPFAPKALEAGRIVWEQGLPDITSDSEAGLRIRNERYDSLLRVGLGANLELQLGADSVEHVVAKTHESVLFHKTGSGDTSLGLKAEIPKFSDSLSLGVLANGSFRSGDAVFRDDPNYNLGATLNWQLTEAQSLTYYANVNHVRHERDETETTLAISYGLDIGAGFGTFAEFGLDIPDQGLSQELIGGGFTYLVASCVQLDLYADWGMNDHSQEVQYGFGASFVLH